MEYAKSHGIPTHHQTSSTVSMRNLWGRSIEGDILEDPMVETPEEASSVLDTFK